MIAVIMQPTYLPWIGYFDLMDQADVFVFLDTVQFEKQSWQQRNRIKTPGGDSLWLTVPVAQGLGQKISAVRIDNARRWPRKHWGSIEQCYRQAPHWDAHASGLKEIYLQTWEGLAELNMAVIRFLKRGLGIRTDLARASDLPVSGSRVGLLVDICRHFGADTYLSPARSAEYIEADNRFEREGIVLQYHRFEHPGYAQLHGEFVPYLSALDLLFNEGPSALEIVRSGRTQA